jgi:hypothetical protein
MMRYDIDFTIDGEWHHTFGESTYPSDLNFEKGNYTEEGVSHNARLIIDAFMDMGHLHGYVNPSNIKVHIDKI